MDDKIWIVFCLTVIVLALIWTGHPETSRSVDLVISGFMGMAVGAGFTKKEAK